MDIKKLQTAIDKAMSMNDFKVGAGNIGPNGSTIQVSEHEKMINEPKTENRRKSMMNVIGRDLSGGERRLRKMDQSDAVAYDPSLKTGPSPKRAQPANIITEADDDYENQIDVNLMDKISQKLNLDVQKFKSMNKHSQKNMDQVIMDYKLLITQDAQKNSSTFNSAQRSKKFQTSTDPRFRIMSPSRQSSNPNSSNPSRMSNILEGKIDEEFLKKMDEDKYREELCKRIFHVLMKDYDEDKMEFNNPEYEIPNRSMDLR